MSIEGPGQKPPPHCKVMLLCDQVIVEAVTGRASIIAVLSEFRVHEVPGAIGRFSVFLQLADAASAEAEIAVEIHDLSDGQVIVRSEPISIAFPRRLQAVNLVIPCPTIIIYHDGPYDLIAFADGIELDRQRFQVHLVEENESDGDTQNE